MAELVQPKAEEGGCSAEAAAAYEAGHFPAEFYPAQDVYGQQQQQYYPQQMDYYAGYDTSLEDAQIMMGCHPGQQQQQHVLPDQQHQYEHYDVGMMEQQGKKDSTK